jgi:hypothetical protein
MLHVADDISYAKGMEQSKMHSILLGNVPMSVNVRPHVATGYVRHSWSSAWASDEASPAKWCLL